ncbi:MAG: restriction endonuclease subunit S [Christensenellales bacterium]
MTPQELKSSILQLAIQGKLVEQRPEEGTGEELYQQIQAEKKRLIQEGKIKKEKPLPEIAEDEVPFEIPESWKWVQIRDIAIKITDGTHHSPANYEQGKYRYVTAKNIKNQGITLTNITYVSEDVHNEIFARCNPEHGDVLLIKDGATTGVVTVNNLIEPFSMLSSVALLKMPSLMSAWYLVYVMRSDLLYKAVRAQMKGTGITRITLKQIELMTIPLPPLAEQKRIVAKIEELLPYLDRYEKAWNRLEEFNRRFPADMQKSILQMAIQGKLVEQRPEEGTGEELYRQIQAEKQALIKAGKIKKEKPLPEIAEDEVPFEIPEGWKWVYFGELYSLSNGTASRGTEGGIERPVLRLADLSGNTINTENVRKISLTEREFLSHKVQKDDLLFVRVNGSKERVATAFHYTAEKTISYCDHLFCGHKCSSLVDVDYVMFAFNCWATRKQLIPEIKTTAGQNTINQTSMARILLPLPPLAEQKRIVARLEEILPLCERLK